jgi:valyl-tRNA synthetase
MAVITDAVTALRNIRSEMNVPPSSRPHADILCRDSCAAAVLQEHTETVISLAGLSSCAVHREFERPRSAATAVVRSMELFMALEGLIDFEAERSRLQKEMKKLQKDIEFVTKKLANEKFLNRAPAEIVDKEKQKARELEEKAATLQNNIERISRLCA